MHFIYNVYTNLVEIPDDNWETHKTHISHFYMFRCTDQRNTPTSTVSFLNFKKEKNKSAWVYFSLNKYIMFGRKKNVSYLILSNRQKIQN